MVVAYAPTDLADACGEDPSQVCEWVYDATDSESAAEIVDWIVNRPLRIVLIILGAWIVNRLARRAIDRFVRRLVTERSADPDDESGLLVGLELKAAKRLQRLQESNERASQRTVTLGAVLTSIASGVIILLAALLVLGELDVNLGPLLAGAGIAGIAFGFGAQSLVKDFLAGIFIVIEDQYGVGDIVDVGEASGTIEQVSLRTTRLRDINGTLWFVPNGEIHRVGNKSQLWARVILDVDVAYDTPVDVAIAVIKRVADGLWHDRVEDATIIEEPEVWGVENFGPDAISIRLALRTEPSEQFTTARILRARLKVALDEAGIEIPFPQRTIWFADGPSDR